MKLRPELFLVYLSPALLAVLAVAFVMHNRHLSNGAEGDHASGEDTFREVLALAESHYVDEVSREDLIHGAVKGMMDVLDRYSKATTQRNGCVSIEPAKGVR